MSVECSSSNIPPGYKQTEVGVIPEDWEVKSIVEIAPLQRGFDLPTSQLKAGPYPVVYSNGIMNFHKYAMARGPGVITGRSGTLGRVHYVETDYWPHNTSLWVTRFNNNDPLFIYYLYTSIGFERFSSGSGVPTLNRNDAHAFCAAIPSSVDEQEAIAEALGDADAFIESLEQLISKKRQIKQGAMQELLTGKRRLPGFSGEWEVKQLGDIAEIIMGQSPSSANYNSKGEGLPLIQGNADIFNRKTIKRVFTTEVTKRGQYGDIIMSVRAPVGEVSRATFDICLGRGVCAIRYSNDFLYHALIAKESTWAKLSKGSTFDSVNSADIKAFDIEMPADYAEQTAITSILSNMDSEIAALEEKLAKASQIKQGMMQELLTGRIRLL